MLIHFQHSGYWTNYFHSPEMKKKFPLFWEAPKVLCLFKQIWPLHRYSQPKEK